MKESEAVDISIIVPCRNEEKFIQEAIKRIMEQEGAGVEFTFELLVIDGNSTDRTVHMIEQEREKYGRLKLLINHKGTTPSAFNIGIRNAAGRFICILGAHVEIERDYLLKCLEAINKVDADNVGGPWRAKGRSYLGRAIASAFQSAFSAGGAKSHNIEYEGYVDSVWGGFYKREVFDRICLFDEELIRNQDDELNYRLIKSGGKIWQTSAIKYSYICRNSIRKLFMQYFQYGYWKVLVIQKHKRPSALRHMVPGLFVISLSLLSLMSFFSPFAFKLLLTLVLVYSGLNLAATLYICNNISGFSLIPVMPVIFLSFHIGYGCGFLSGVVDFIILKRNKNMAKCISLTR